MSSQPTGELNGARAPLPTAPVTGSGPTEEQVREGLVKSQRLMLAVGEIISVVMRSRSYRATPVGEIYDMIVPAVSSEQYLIARAYSPSSGLTSPVAVALWARVSEAVDQRLSQQAEGPTLLTAQEWVSGDIPWLIAYLGDPGAINRMLEVLQNKTLGGKVLKVRTQGKDGKFVTRAFAPVGLEPAGR